MLTQFIEKLRHVTLVIVAGLTVLMFAVIAVATRDLFQLVSVWFTNPKALPAVDALYLVDLYLVAVVLLVLVVGLYKLFVDAAIQTPAWLEVKDLNALKSKVIRTIILVLAVTFTKEATSQGEATDVAAIGIGIAAMIIALAVYVRADAEHSGVQAPESP